LWDIKHPSKLSLTWLQRLNEKTLKRLVENCDGVYGTAAEAIDYLAIPEVKTVRPFSNYTGKLSLGDWKKYEDSALYIDVKRYSKITQAKPVSASSFVSRSTTGTASAQSSHTLAGDIDMADAPSTVGDLAAVKNARSYSVKTDQEGSVKGKMNVERDELAKGYEYGRTAVPISESEENVTKLETFAEFTIIGFIPCDKVCVVVFLNPQSRSFD
jgi:ATP-dependent DNA helicase 2 subunit 2